MSATFFCQRTGSRVSWGVASLGPQKPGEIEKYWFPVAVDADSRAAGKYWCQESGWSGVCW
jgi:hypothetical protein